MEEKYYWLGFSAFSGIGPVKFNLLITHFGSAKAAWEALEIDLVASGIGEKIVAQFLDFRKTFSLQNYAEKLAAKNVSFLILNEPSYPVLLKQIKKPPFVLYTKGNVDLLSMRNSGSFSSHPTSSKKSSSAFGETADFLRALDGTSNHVSFSYIGIVGTRKVTQYGRDVTQMITRELVQAGCTIVSGLALGVDTIAHATTIAEKGKTIAVLGCGVDCCTPSENQNLYDQIMQSGGAIVSELPLGHSPTKGSFPARNRIIAGLSQGIVVTEGAVDSGALITASNAASLHRPVFAVPGPITSSLSEGPHNLLEKGAILVTKGEDILREFQISNFKSQINTNNQKLKNSRGETKEEQIILELLQNEPLHFNDLVRRSQLSSTQLGSLLSMMEVKGLLKSLDGGMFSCN